MTVPIIPVERSGRDAHFVTLRAQKRTLSEIGAAYGVTKERVRQVVARLHAVSAAAARREEARCACGSDVLFAIAPGMDGRLDVGWCRACWVQRFGRLA